MHINKINHGICSECFDQQFKKPVYIVCFCVCPIQVSIHLCDKHLLELFKRIYTHTSGVDVMAEGRII